MNGNIKCLRVKVLALFAIILVIPVVLSGCGSVSAEDVAKKAAQAYIDGDAAAYYQLLAPGYVEYMIGKDGWYKTAEEFQKDAIQDNIDELKDKFIDRCGKGDADKILDQLRVRRFICILTKTASVL